MNRTALALAVVALTATSAHATPIVAHATASTIHPNAATCHLAYGGGPLIQHVKIFDVFYSPNYQYKDMLTSFYTAITQSAYLDMLSEYNVGSYKIARGSYIGLYEDTNPNPAQPKTLDPEAYLKGLLAGNKLPAPDDDTLYMIYFPSGIDPTLQGSGSCISGGGFCAYHNSYTTAGGQLVRYGVMPDTSSGSCAGGCGPAGFPGLTDVSSHEFAEAVTDPDGNTAWVDTKQGCGENGDICAGGAMETGTVATFTVQKEWSNALNACVVTNPNIQVNDFSVAATPTTVVVPQGGTATAMVTLTKVSGMAETATLTATALPAGVSASFVPPTATSAGGTSAVTVSANSTATLGMAKFTIKAAGPSVSHTQDVQLMIVAPPDMAMSPDLAQPAGGGSGGTGGGGSGGAGGGGSGGTGGNGNNGGSGCSIGGTEVGSAWAFAAFLLLAIASRRRRC